MKKEIKDIIYSINSWLIKCPRACMFPFFFEKVGSSDIEWNTVDTILFAKSPFRELGDIIDLTKEGWFKGEIVWFKEGKFFFSWRWDWFQ